MRAKPSEVVEHGYQPVGTREQELKRVHAHLAAGAPIVDEVVTPTMRLRHFASGATMPVHRARMVEPEARPKTGNGQAARLRRQRERREAKERERALRVALRGVVPVATDAPHPFSTEIAAMGKAALEAQLTADDPHGRTIAIGSDGLPVVVV